MENGSLGKFVTEYHAAGVAWVEAKLKSDQLEEDQKPFLASLMNALDDGKTSEAKLDRLARGSTQYREYVKNMVLSKAEALREKVRYDALGSFYEAKRSEKALERSKIEKGLFHQGS